jgi:hypothetical protein
MQCVHVLWYTRLTRLGLSRRMVQLLHVGSPNFQPAASLRAASDLAMMQGQAVKIALPPDPSRRRFIMSQLSSTPAYVLEEQVQLPTHQPLDLAKLMEVQPKQQQAGGSQGQGIVFDDELDDIPPVPVLSVASSKVEAAVAEQETEQGRPSAVLGKELATTADGADLELAFRFEELRKFERTLDKEVQALITAAKEKCRHLKSTLPLSAYHQQALLPKRQLGFICSEPPPRPSPPQVDKKRFDPVTWPVYPADWHIQAWEALKKEEKLEAEQDARSFIDLQAEGASHNLYASFAPSTSGVDRHAIRKNAPQSDGLSAEALSGLLSMETTRRPSHRLDETVMATMTSPPKQPRPSASFLSPRIKKLA